MRNRHRIIKSACTAAYIAAVVVLLFYVLFKTDLFAPGYREHVRDFSGNWRLESGETATAENLSAGDFGGSVTLEKTLPQELSEDDAFCFRTQNANVTVWVGGQETYRFESRENVTGKGCGVVFHIVGLSPGDAGQTLRLQLSSVLESRNGGRIWRAKLCAGADYVRWAAEEKLLPFTLSILILFFGVLLLAIYVWIPDKSAMPYDIAAFGSSVLLLGVWCLIDTDIPQLITGNIYTCRVLDKLLLYFVGYPLICFVNSLTRIKRTIYPRIAFALMALNLALLLGLRYGCGIDMTRLHLLNYAYYASTFLMLAVILADNARWCRKKDLHTELARAYWGVGIFATCAMTDMLAYSRKLGSGMFGVFMRFGLTIFIALMLIQFLRWWSGEHATFERSRFINRALQYAVSANEPEVSIRALLEYLGTELRAKRTYIFEDRSEGVWYNTYEWFAADREPRKPEWNTLPYAGLIDVLYEEFKRSDRLIVDNVEAYRTENPLFYRVLRENGVERMVAGPLETNGKLIGLFGVDDAPQEALMEISEIIRLISYFFAQLVMRREEQKRLLLYSYYDALTGVRNRRAFSEFVERELDAGSPYGYIMCDINGLKAANDKFGHEAGDAMIVDVAKSLAEVFDAKNVYRMGGDEFAAYGFERDEAAFAADVERVKALIAEKGRSASIGAVFSADGAMDKEQVKAEADARMYQEKERYYQGRSDRRRH